MVALRHLRPSLLVILNAALVALAKDARPGQEASGHDTAHSAVVDAAGDSAASRGVPSTKERRPDRAFIRRERNAAEDDATGNANVPHQQQQLPHHPSLGEAIPVVHVHGSASKPSAKVLVSTCADLSSNATDIFGSGCKAYGYNPTWCSKYDDEDFTSHTMCCACQDATKQDAFGYCGWVEAAEIEHISCSKPVCEDDSSCDSVLGCRTACHACEGCIGFDLKEDGDCSMLGKVVYNDAIAFHAELPESQKVSVYINSREEVCKAHGKFLDEPTTPPVLASTCVPCSGIKDCAHGLEHCQNLDSGEVLLHDQSCPLSGACACLSKQADTSGKSASSAECAVDSGYIRLGQDVPHNGLCGRDGGTQEGAYLLTAANTTRAKCSSLCSVNKLCEGFNWLEEHDGKCQLAKHCDSFFKLHGKANGKYHVYAKVPTMRREIPIAENVTGRFSLLVSDPAAFVDSDLSKRALVETIANVSGVSAEYVSVFELLFRDTMAANWSLPGDPTLLPSTLLEGALSAGDAGAVACKFVLGIPDAIDTVDVRARLDILVDKTFASVVNLYLVEAAAGSVSGVLSFVVDPAPRAAGGRILGAYALDMSAGEAEDFAQSSAVRRAIEEFVGDVSGLPASAVSATVKLDPPAVDAEGTQHRRAWASYSINIPRQMDPNDPYTKLAQSQIHASEHMLLGTLSYQKVALPKGFVLSVVMAPVLINEGSGSTTRTTTLVNWQRSVVEGTMTMDASSSHKFVGDSGVQNALAAAIAKFSGIPAEHVELSMQADNSSCLPLMAGEDPRQCVTAKYAITVLSKGESHEANEEVHVAASNVYNAMRNISIQGVTHAFEEALATAELDGGQGQGFQVASIGIPSMTHLSEVKHTSTSKSFQTLADGKFYLPAFKVEDDGGLHFARLHVQATADAHVALITGSPHTVMQDGSINPPVYFYDFCFGCSGNTQALVWRQGDRSWSSGPAPERAQALASQTVADSYGGHLQAGFSNALGVLNTTGNSELWVSVDVHTGRIAAGTGDDIKKNVLLEAVDPSPMTPAYLALMTGHTSTGGSWSTLST